MSPPIAGNGTNLSTSRATPCVDFTSADFDSINADLTTYAQATYSGVWTDFNVNQFAVVFKELVAYLGDLLSYQLNSEIREVFAATVIRRQNLVNIGKTFNYVPQGETPATVSLVLTMDPTGTYPCTIKRTDQYSTGAGTNQVNFSPDIDTVVPSYPGGGTITIDATEGTYYEGVLIGVSTGAPNQQWQFPQNGVQTSSISLFVSASQWTATPNLTLNESTDNVFKVSQTDDGNTYSVFGDGTFGAIPPTNAQITASFNVSSAGATGNVTAGTVMNKNTTAAVLGVINPANATNGNPVQTMASARQGIPATLSTQDRYVTDLDYQNGIGQIAGVATCVCVPGYPAGSRTIQVYVAPDGGGAPTPALLSSISAAVQPKKMVANRLRLAGPFYKNIRLNVLLHINSTFRASDTLAAVSGGLSNVKGTGLLDFAQLDFGAVTTDANGDVELLLSQTRLQTYFASMAASGLDRAEIQQLDVEPVGRVSVSGNTGNGTVTNIVLSSRQHRRQYAIALTSASTFIVYERIVGQVTSLTDTVLSDANQVFDNESIPVNTPSYFSGWYLVADATSTTKSTVVQATGSDITVTSLSSLFSQTEVGANYYLYSPTGIVGAVGGSAVTSTDGAVSFQVTAGSTSFLAGDSFILDVYPLVSDLIMGVDEYPSLIAANLTLRTSGGSRV